MGSDLLLAALLALFHPPRDIRACIERRRDDIISALVAAEHDRDVPPEILLVTAFLETHVGCDSREGGNWGAPASRRNRHRPGSPDDAAAALERGFRRCHTWLGAIGMFRAGMCRPPRLIGYDPDFAMRTVRRVCARAGVQCSSLQPVRDPPHDGAESVPDSVEPGC